jgi:hypothetical protein
MLILKVRLYVRSIYQFLGYSCRSVSVFGIQNFYVRCAQFMVGLQFLCQVCIVFILGTLTTVYAMSTDRFLSKLWRPISMLGSEATFIILWCVMRHRGVGDVRRLFLTPTRRMSWYPRRVIKGSGFSADYSLFSSANNSYNAYNNYTTRYI